MLGPTETSRLIPNYLHTMPTCPSAGNDTYSQSLNTEIEPDRYALYCAGHNHKVQDVARDHPQFTSQNGLIER
jgi:hypothetical protein